MNVEEGSRVAVWHAMAEHFLDTETRHSLPLTAFVCVEFGLTPEETARIWTDEVVPAVGSNLLSVAGEWAGWDTSWLVQRIESRRRPSAFARCFLVFERCAAKPYWNAIAACMSELLPLTAEAQKQRATDLVNLGRLYWDFAPSTFALDEASRARLDALFPETFERLLASVIPKEERLEGARRVAARLKKAPAPSDGTIPG